MTESSILVVEDERLVALSIREILRAEGFEVCGIANSASKALHSIAEMKPGMVIMDVKIKGSMDGIDLALRIRKDHGIPSVFLTAYSDEKLLDRAKLAEPLGYILKPFKPSDIVSAVKVALYKSKEEKKRDNHSLQLEEEVERRTRKLSGEILIRKEAERQLQQQSAHLQDANTALRTLLNTRDAEQRALEESLLLNIRKYVMPYVEMLRQQISDEAVLETVSFLEDALKKTVSPASKTLFGKYLDLTPQESKIADLIRQGKKTKDIADILNLAPSSISTHRYSIRKKLGLLNSSTNLETYLKSVESGS